MLTRNALAPVAAWADRLAAPDLDIGTWAGGERDASGVIQMPWFELGATAEAFLADVRGAGLVQPFDWPAWAATPAAQAMLRDPEPISTASADDLLRLVTTIVRSDRFHEGAIASAFERGLFLAIARRARALLEEPPA